MIMKNALKTIRQAIKTAYDYTQYANHKIRFVGPDGIVTVMKFNTTKDTATVVVETDGVVEKTEIKFSQVMRAAERCRFEKQQAGYAL